MNVASITLYISQITFGIIFTFALISFVIYKLRGKKFEKQAVQNRNRPKRREPEMIQNDLYSDNPNIVYHTVATVPITADINSHEMDSRIMHEEMKNKSTFEYHRSRFTVMNPTFEQVVNKQPSIQNWS